MAKRDAWKPFLKMMWTTESARMGQLKTDNGFARAFMLSAMGCDTGIDLTALLALRAKVAGWLAGEPTHGALWQAGLPKTFRAAA